MKSLQSPLTAAAATVLVLALSPASAEAAPTAGDSAAGKKAFVACASCHQVGPSARGGFGPQLNGIIGRPAGTSADYRYSAALQKAGFVWSEPLLAAFIKDPERLVPGTKMRFSSLGYNERRIADLLAYLRTLPATTP